MGILGFNQKEELGLIQKENSYAFGNLSAPSATGIAIIRGLDYPGLCEEIKEEAISHGILVSNLAYSLAKELNLSEKICLELAEAGIVHDIGKLKLGEYLDGKENDTLKIEEMKYIRLHPELGAQILKDHRCHSVEVLTSIYHHHENFDGSGYPDNLSGNAIPYGARILRTCDVFAALVTERAYRSSFEVDTAIELMIDEVKNFDMEIFLAFLRFVHSKEFEPIRDYVIYVNNNSMAKSEVELY
ncbi:MAG TPA: phosphohydrolase [Lachnoclostridium phytofermentans]|uniref:Phosphohydrolase n=1 Tax=Lachnoclostridium phytofermentans TaxID=66219 RepID=A0A3D2XBZ4_9FIRM|nr:HD domain-containing phosphohydrolase [Lachnoclostridium sp.]HCL04277.1 phosphohydrolase [Lachnoclostridium phytofermentans]